MDGINRETGYSAPARNYCRAVKQQKQAALMGLGLQQDGGLQPHTKLPPLCIPTAGAGQSCTCCCVTRTTNPKSSGWPNFSQARPQVPLEAGNPGGSLAGGFDTSVLVGWGRTWGGTVSLRWPRAAGMCRGAKGGGQPGAWLGSILILILLQQDSDSPESLSPWSCQALGQKTVAAVHL